MTDVRVESDSLGQVEVPAEKLWGARIACHPMSTRRSLYSFMQ
jgi:fumarate hydratase class II